MDATLSDDLRIRTIRDTLDAPPPASRTHMPASEWYVQNAANFVAVPAEDIAFHADGRYDKWRRLPVGVDVECNMHSGLRESVQSMSDAQLAARLDEIPEGLETVPGSSGFSFTPFQLLSISTWLQLPHDVEVKATVSVQILNAMANFGASERRKANPMSACFSMPKGSNPDFTIVDLPTAAGKTAWSLAAVCVLLTSSHFSRLLEVFGRKRSGTIMQGPVEVKVARLAIIATTATTFSHFYDTLLRLLPAMRRKHPEIVYVVWTTMASGHSVEEAYRLGSRDDKTVVLWCICVGELNKVLRKTPEIAVAACVIDEYTVDTPKERSLTNKSQVIKCLVPQATVQALMEATTGYGSELKTLLGKLQSPCEWHRIVAARQWTDAQVGLNQACKLHLMTLPSPYRSLIRKDLAFLMPDGMHVHLLRSRLLTMSAHISRAQVDMVPTSFVNVLLSYLRLARHDLSTASTTLVQGLGDGHCTPEDIKSVLRRLTFDGLAHLDSDGILKAVLALQRLHTLVDEFGEQCPICWESKGRSALAEDDVAERRSVQVCGKCGYCTCLPCFRSMSRCAFCRAPVAREVPTVPAAPSGAAAEEDSALYPMCPDFGEVLGDFGHDLTAHSSAQAQQQGNLVMALHALMRHAYKRLLILVECAHGQQRRMDDYLSLPRMQSVTGYQMTRVDTLLNGKGTAFASVKRAFDDPSSPAMALVCYGMDDRFLVGTDLAHADAVVSVGNIPSRILTQTLGRVFRPRVGRPTNRAVKMIKIYAGHHAMRRRRRADSDLEEEE